MILTVYLQSCQMSGYWTSSQSSGDICLYLSLPPLPLPGAWYSPPSLRRLLYGASAVSRLHSTWEQGKLGSFGVRIPQRSCTLYASVNMIHHSLPLLLLSTTLLPPAPLLYSYSALVLTFPVAPPSHWRNSLVFFMLWNVRWEAPPPLGMTVSVSSLYCSTLASGSWCHYLFV